MYALEKIMAKELWTFSAFGMYIRNEDYSHTYDDCTVILSITKITWQICISSSIIWLLVFMEKCPNAIMFGHCCPFIDMSTRFELIAIALQGIFVDLINQSVTINDLTKDISIPSSFFNHSFRYVATSHHMCSSVNQSIHTIKFMFIFSRYCFAHEFCKLHVWSWTIILIYSNIFSSRHIHFIVNKNNYYEMVLIMVI